MKEYKWMSLDDVLRSIPAMDKQNVSEVARGKKKSKQTKEGWVQAFIATNGSPKKMGERLTGRSDWETWKDRRQQFLARHLKQIKTSGEKIWKDGEPSRRHLALVAWGYTPTPKKFKEWLKTQPTLSSEEWKKGVKMPKKNPYKNVIEGRLAVTMNGKDYPLQNPIKAEHILKLQQLLFSDNEDAQIQGVELLSAVADTPSDIYDVLGSDWGDEVVPQNLDDLQYRFYLNVSLQIVQLLSDLGDNTIINNTKELSLMNFQLTTLPESIGLLTNLTELELHANKLTTLPDSIRYLTNLTDITLSRNKFTTLPTWIGELTNLTTLNLNDNQLTSLPKSIENLTNLTDLSLWNNQLTTLPESIQNLTNLTLLDLSSNQLTDLPESIGNLTNLTELDLKWNQLTILPESIENLTLLTSIDLNDNELTSLPESIGNLTNLSYLSLISNQLTSLPKSILNLKNLTSLNLANNNLGEIPSYIGNLINLTYLNLYRTRLTTLPTSIGNLTNLTELYLSENQLTDLPESIENLINLQYIILDDEAPSELRNFLIYTLGLKETEIYGGFEYESEKPNPLQNPKSNTTYDLITDSKGRKIPKRYVSGYKGKDKSKRVNEIEKRRDEYDKAKDKYGAEKNFPKKVLQKLYRPFRTDKGVKTTPSKYTKIAKDRGIVGDLNEKAKTASKYYGGKISKPLLKKVYDKGMGAWSSGGHRVGASSHAWAMARVNSFLVGGKTYWTADNYLAKQLPVKVRKAIEKKPAWKPNYRKNPLPLIKLHSELIPIEDMNSKRWFKSNHNDFYYHLDRNIFPTEIGDVVMDTIDPCLVSLVAFLIQRGVLTGSSCQGHDEDNLIDQRFSNHMHDIQQVRTKGLVVTDLETEDQYLWHDPQYTSPYHNVEDMTLYISSTEVKGALTVYLCQDDFKIFHELSQMIDSLGFDMIVPDNYQTEEVIEMTITTSAKSEQEICDKWNALENLLKQYIS